GRAARHEPMRALAELPSHMLLKGALIQLVITEWRDQRDERSPEHRFLGLRHYGCTIIPAALGFNNATSLAKTGPESGRLTGVGSRALLQPAKNRTPIASSLTRQGAGCLFPKFYGLVLAASIILFVPVSGAAAQTLSTSDLQAMRSALAAAQSGDFGRAYAE